MKKDEVRDYATAAFRFWARHGCPTYEEAAERIRQRAFDILAKEYEGLTEAAVKRFLPSFDIRNGENPVFGEEDLRQCAALALFKAAQTYDEGKKVSFGLYAKICVNNALISTLRKYKTEQKRQRRAKERENKAQKRSPTVLCCGSGSIPRFH